MKNELTFEQLEKLNACKTPEEVKLFAEKESIELTDKQLEAIAGGDFNKRVCQYCGQVVFSDFWLHHLNSHKAK